MALDRMMEYPENIPGFDGKTKTRQFTVEFKSCFTLFNLTLVHKHTSNPVSLLVTPEALVFESAIDDAAIATRSIFSSDLLRPFNVEQTFVGTIKGTIFHSLSRWAKIKVSTVRLCLEAGVLCFHGLDALNEIVVSQQCIVLNTLFRVINLDYNDYLYKRTVSLHDLVDAMKVVPPAFVLTAEENGSRLVFSGYDSTGESRVVVRCNTDEKGTHCRVQSDMELCFMKNQFDPLVCFLKNSMYVTIGFHPGKPLMLCLYPTVTLSCMTPESSMIQFFLVPFRRSDDT